MPLNVNIELTGNFYWEKLSLASIIVSRTWKLRFTLKRISRYGSGLLMTQLKQSLYLFTYEYYSESYMEIEVYLEKNFQVWVRITHDPAQTKSLLIYLLTSIIVSRT